MSTAVGPPISTPAGPDPDLGYASAAELVRLLEARELTSVELVDALLRRIASLDAGEHGVRAVLALDPDAGAAAARLDGMRAAGRLLGPLHGVPVLVKDNVETAGPLGATAGSLALADAPVERDARAVARLRAAGAIVLGKANLSEWANFRSNHSSSGWSAVGGQTRNPYALDRSPSGSSSGSGVALAAGFAPIALGTETDGSIVCPAAVNGVVGMKPTHGLVSTEGVVPLAASQDTVGPLGRCVADVALALDVLAGTSVHSAAVSPDGCAGARIGVARTHYTGFHAGADRCLAAALDAARSASATVLDPVDVPTAVELAGFADEYLVLCCELHDGLDRYLLRRDAGRGVCPRSLDELVGFNEAHAATELALFGQDVLVDAAATGPLTDPAYLGAFTRNRERARGRGLDAAFAASGADVIVTLTMGPARHIDQVNGDPSVTISSSPAAVAGYPALSLPIGTAGGLPVGATLMGRRGDDATLVRVAAGLEHALGLTQRPSFVPTLALA